MKKGSMRKIRCLLLGIVAVAAFAAIGATSASAKVGLSAGKAASGTSTTCPNGPPGGLQPSNNVGASVETSGGTDTYFFESFENESPVEGVPGLIKYCVYPPPSTAPTGVEATRAGWLGLKAKKGSAFSFVRPGGNKTNIPLDGETTEMGTATWSGTAPNETEQTIVLHINDPTVCAALYPAGQEEVPSGTCFVLPGEREQKPVCNAGGSGVFGYNDIPADFAKGCPLPPSFGFEAHPGTSEFGDGVGLAGTGTHITSMTVDFQSYGCSKSGRWYQGVTAPCVTESPAPPTFTIPASAPDPEGIVAHLYEVGSGGTVGAKIADSTPNTEAIPFRPSANAEKCTEPPPEAGIEPGSAWFDEATGECHFSISKLMTFSFPGGPAVPAGRQVIWTVTFNTSNSGYHPLGNATSCRTTNGGNPGCGYDSLNVGTKTYEGAPYSGSDLEVNGVYWNKTAAPILGLALESNLAEEWIEYKPLAQITTGP